MKKIFSIVFIVGFVFILASCSSPYPGDRYYDEAFIDGIDSDEHQMIVENPFVNTAVNNKSNISLSSNTAAYSFIRSQINSGKTVDRNVVRIEEMVNFFRYEYNQPLEGDVFGFKSELIETPWNPETHLLLVGLETKKVDLGDVPTNLVVLLDVSGSMSASNKLPLVKASMKLLLEQMKPQDKISLVTYSSGEKVIFEGKTIEDLTYINRQIDILRASGSTAGKKGLEMAYEVAQTHFIEGGNNRIILATDGDFNVGISNTNTLVEYISEKRESGIYFSAFGFGYGNYKDEKLERIAMAGNGVYHYIDDMLSARKAFVDNIDGLLYTVARDAKAQIEFNHNAVLEYRLIGYENRQLSNEQFDDETTDAGEIGTGLQVTAIYEVKLQEQAIDDLASLMIRYKAHDTTDETELETQFDVLNVLNQFPSKDASFISAVVEFGLLLINSEYKVDASLDALIERIKSDPNNSTDYYRSDFVETLEKYQLMVQ
ncbi:MAG: von Willebrand factor type A domain-containing protein [Acholeplasma sp.]